MNKRPSLTDGLEVLFIIFGSMFVTCLCLLIFLINVEKIFPPQEISISVMYNRLGLFLQLLSVFSVLPELIGQDRAEKWELSFKNLSSQIKNELFRISKYEADSDPAVLFIDGVPAISFIGEITKFAFLIFMIIISLSITGNETIESLIVLYIIPDSVLFLWLCSKFILFIVDKKPFLLVIHIYLVTNKILTIITSPFTIGVASFIQPIAPIIYKLSKYPIRDLFLRVTFHLLLLGTILQFLATFH